jgi:hypothetical protein
LLDLKPASGPISREGPKRANPFKERAWLAGGDAMKHSQGSGTDDRLSTRKELHEVFGLLVELRQLPVEVTSESLEAPESPSAADDLELWTDAHHDRWSGEIEPLASIILGRRQKLN